MKDKAKRRDSLLRTQIDRVVVESIKRVGKLID
jgi:hypothetical protein